MAAQECVGLSNGLLMFSLALQSHLMMLPSNMSVSSQIVPKEAPLLHSYITFISDGLKDSMYASAPAPNRAKRRLA